MTNEFTRREFLKRSAVLGAGTALASTGLTGAAFGMPRLDSYNPGIDLAIARGPSPADNALAAVDALGGFRKFVKKGDRVVIKPNPIGSSPPEMAVNTHPDMVEAVVRECYRAGAAEVLAVSNDQRNSIEGNGTLAAVERAGGKFKVLNDVSMYREVVIPRGRVLRRDLFAIDVLEADVFINMPIAKHHAGARVTFSMKNLMGINWDRIFYHRSDLQRCIAEAATAIKHSLIIMDANHVLLTNGPAGPGRVLDPQRVIAGVNPVAVDAATLQFFRQKPEDIGHIRIAHELGVGEMDVDKLKVKEFDA
ncbi:MAG: DUF362 domain-containing protein [Candidatus Eisenbacteria sp.]|nr:DUF362 domain-containing protein [Candidatus Eisenbacteria bacterium]